jgi:hypothetical protein
MAPYPLQKSTGRSGIGSGGVVDAAVTFNGATALEAAAPTVEVRAEATLEALDVW